MGDRQWPDPINVAAYLEITEREWAAQVYELLKMLGWHRYHTYRSKHSQAGYPDETCWRERVLWLELKRETGKLSEEQKRVIRGLLGAGGEVYVVRPSDLDALVKVLQHRNVPRTEIIGLPATSDEVAASELRERTRLEVTPAAETPPPV